MHTINDFNYKGKRVIVRVDFNVPLNDKFEITDNKRIRAALPTIRKLLADGAAVILMSHLGRPKQGREEKFSLKHLVPELESLLGSKVHFASDCIGTKVEQKAKSLEAGEVLLLENLRFYKEEAAGEKLFSIKLAALADCYVNDAFGTAHRAHASTAIIAESFPNDKAAGLLLAGEITNAQKVLGGAERPYVAIMGGAKVSDKILIIEKLLDKVDHLIIGGGMVYTFFKAMGGTIGNSLCEDEKLELAKELLSKAKEMGVQIHLPKDSVIASNFSNDVPTKVADNMEIPDDWMGLDIGPDSVGKFCDVIRTCKTILWNGPMGVFEMSNFENGTRSVAQAIVDATRRGAYSLIGGGDSAAAIAKFGMEDEVSYVSTGGGALLEYMEGKELPGLAALE